MTNNFKQIQGSITEEEWNCIFFPSLTQEKEQILILANKIYFCDTSILVGNYFCAIFDFATTTDITMVVHNGVWVMELNKILI